MRRSVVLVAVAVLVVAVVAGAVSAFLAGRSGSVAPPAGTATADGRAPTQARWVVTDLGTLGGNESGASEVNDRGQVVGDGNALTPDGLQRVESRAFLWQDGRMTELDTLGGTESYASDINNHGQIVGWATTEAGRKHAVRWTLRRGI